MSVWVDNAQTHEGAQHLIEAAVFELSFGSEMADWAYEPQLERIVETELLAVIDEVFNEVASTRGAVRIDNLEIDLGSVRYDGTWNGARERLRDLLHAALGDVVASNETKGDNRYRAHTAALQTPAQPDVLTYFLLYGSLPTGVRVKDALSMESLLQTKIRSELRRLADLILSPSSGGVVVARLARQFSDLALEQLVRALSPSHADVLVTFARGLRRVATERGSEPVWQGEMRPALWSHLLTILVAPNRPQIDLVARKVLRESAGFLGLTLHQLARRLSGLVAGSEAPAALIRRLASDAAPLSPVVDNLVKGLERGQADAVELALKKLRSRDLPLAVLSNRLSTLGHRRLIDGIFEAIGRRPEGTSELGNAIESYAQRSGNTKGFYRQVLERLMAGDLIDLEAINAQSQGGQRQGEHQESTQHPRKEVATELDAATQVSVLEEERATLQGRTGDDATQALALYLRAGARTLGVDRQRLMDVAEHLLRKSPDEAIGLLRHVLSGADEAAIVRLVELLPDRLLARALYLLAPIVHTRVQRFTDVVASAFQGLETGLSAARISALKWQYRFRYLLSTAGEMDAQGLADGLIVYLASHTDGPDAGELRSQIRARLGEGVLWTARGAELAGQIHADEASGKDSARIIRGYDLYAQLARHLDGAATFGAQGSSALTQVIDELAHDHPEQLHRVFQELRQGALEKSRAMRLSGTELRALVHAFLSLPPASRQTDRTQLGRSIDAHAERAGDAQAFYGQVLQRLLERQLIDLEAIGATSQSRQYQDAPAQDAEQAGQIRTGEAGQRDSTRAICGDELYVQLAHHLDGAAAPRAQGSPALAQVIGELARDHPEQLHRIFHELRGGILEKSQALRLADAELRALVHAFLSLPPASGQTNRTQLGRSIDEHAGRAGNAQAFYGQVLRRLLERQLIDLEAIGTTSQSRQHQDAPVLDAEQAGQIRTDEAGQRDSARAIRGDDLHAQLARHLGGSAAPGAQGSSALTQVIDELARDHPEQLHRILQELRDGTLEESRALRLSGTDLRAVVQAFLSLQPPSERTDRTQLGRSIDEHAERAGNPQAFYAQVLQRLLAGQLIDLEAIGAISQSRQYQDALAPDAEQAGQIRTDEADRRDSARAIRGDELYVQLAHYLGGAGAPEAQGSQALTRIIDKLARDHPEQLRRIFQELRGGASQKSRVLRLSGTTELRALVHAFLSLLPVSGQTERTQLGRAIDEHAERAGNAQAFYAQVLQRLLEGQLIDLEVIGATSQSRQYQGAPISEAEQAAGKEEHRGTSQRDMSSASAAEDTGEADRVLAAYLRKGALASGTARQILMDHAAALLGRAPKRAGSLLRESLVDEAAVTRLVELLPERLLARALYALAPAMHARVQRYADAVTGAFQELEVGLDSARINKLKWQFCFRYLLSVGEKADLRELVHGLVDFLASHARHLDTDELRGGVQERLAAPSLHSADNVARQAARILAFEDSADLPAASEISLDYPPVPDIERDFGVVEEGIRVTNAGQVIASPYLPRLFGMLDLVEEGSFKSPEERERAVHLLQFMVDEADASAEYDLVLNKVLCGLDTATPICRGISVTSDEKAKIEGLLSAMIQHWKILGNTSVRGLRESFLQREGTLRHESNGWHLSVEPKAFDMLLDRIPWSFSTIKHSWMKEVLHVSWR